MNSDEYESQHKAWLKSDRDVMAEMRGGRFYLVPEWYNDDQEYGQVIVLTDMNYWNVNFHDLVIWCRPHDIKLNGLSLIINDPLILTAFILRWS